MKKKAAVSVVHEAAFLKKDSEETDMRILHISDLHIGKRVNGFSMIEDQKYILERILDIVDEKAVETVIIAGDVYDKNIPPAEAMQIFDSFITALSQKKISVFIISGNHDSAERLSFGNGIMKESGVYFSPVFDGNIRKVTLNDTYGDIDFYMLPFVKPVHVRSFFPESEAESFNDAVKFVINRINPDTGRRNILIAHQFVTGAATCDSEELSIGGLENVDASAFDAFDYTALGHIHKPQKIYRNEVRYSGTPLKYSFSEVNHQKSVTIVEIGEKKPGIPYADITIEAVKLKPLHDLCEIRGKYMDIASKSFYGGNTGFDREDYMHITLTDEEEIPDALGKLRSIYPNIMKLDYDNCRTQNSTLELNFETTEEKSPIELFEELYEVQNNCSISESQRRFLNNLIEKIWEVR